MPLKSIPASEISYLSQLLVNVIASVDKANFSLKRLSGASPEKDSFLQDRLLPFLLLYHP